MTPIPSSPATGRSLHGALTHAAEDRIAAMLGGNVVDEFLKDNSLAYTGAAEQANFPPQGIWSEQSTTFNASLQDFCFSRLVNKKWS